MSFELWLGMKYLFSRKDRFLSIINIISVLGIAIGVMALIVVIGVMSGFDHDLREKIIGTNAHVVIEKETGLKNYEDLMGKVSGIDGVNGLTPYVHGNVFLESRQKAQSLFLRGVDPEREGSVTKINNYLLSKKISHLKPEQVMIGSQMASYYGYRIGDTITVISPASGVTGAGWRYELTVADIFTSGMYDYDMNLIITHLRKAQEIFDLPNHVATGIGVTLNDVYAAPEIKQMIYDTVGFSFLVRTWMEMNSNFFAALKLEKFAMFVILALIVLVASFNIASTLIVTVTSKIKDIGILKSIGVPAASIRRIFTFQGLCLGFVGTGFGLAAGVGLSIALKEYEFIKLPQEIYYIDRLPVLLDWFDISLIVGCAILISFLATIYPSIKAAQLEPVDALRYE